MGMYWCANGNVLVCECAGVAAASGPGAIAVQATTGVQQRTHHYLQSQGCGMHWWHHAGQGPGMEHGCLHVCADDGMPVRCADGGLVRLADVDFVRCQLVYCMSLSAIPSKDLPW